MSVQVGDPIHGFYLDDEELIRMRTWDEESHLEEVELMPAGKPPRFTQDYQPGSMIAFHNKLWEVLASFRLADEPHVWRFICQEIPDLGSDRVVPMHMDNDYGFDWAEALPRVVYELFPSETDARWFFGCLWAPRNGPLVIFTNQEMLQSRVLVKKEYVSTEVLVYEPRVLNSPMVLLALPSGDTYSPG